MGLNDLTIEKLITENNGYKEKMRTIHEEYGRASSDLQDRINVLGYTLNEHLKQTKDQMATTPQRLLNLEMKFVTGDVNESEYRTQRTEFKGLLENNLKSIEEIKLMIDTLSHIETKPLFPGEFKQTYPETKPATMAPGAKPSTVSTYYSQQCCRGESGTNKSSSSYSREQWNRISYSRNNQRSKRSIERSRSQHSSSHCSSSVIGHRILKHSRRIIQPRSIARCCGGCC